MNTNETTFSFFSNAFPTSVIFILVVYKLGTKLKYSREETDSKAFLKIEFMPDSPRLVRVYVFINVCVCVFLFGNTAFP